MKQQLVQRLKALKTEFESGQKALAELENKQTSLRNTLLRISGAIQVLEEELTKCDGDNSKPAMKPDSKQKEKAELSSVVQSEQK